MLKLLGIIEKIVTYKDVKNKLYPNFVYEEKVDIKRRIYPKYLKEEIDRRNEKNSNTSQLVIEDIQF